MLYFSKGKIISIVFTVVWGILFAMPNLLSEQQFKQLPENLQYHLRLGLDLQGGAHLLMQVDEEDLIKERLDTLRDDIRVKLRETKIRARQKIVDDVSIQVRLNEPAQKSILQDAMKDLMAAGQAGLFDGIGVSEVAESSPSENVLIYKLTPDGIEQRIRNAVAQSIDVLGNRINGLGTAEPIVQREGDNRILVQYPGLDADEIPRLKDLLKAEARLSFHSVNQTADPNDILNSGGTPPPGTEIMYEEESDPPRAYLLNSRAIITGDDLSEASSGFDQRSGEALVFFRFNAKGSRIFADFTLKNVGKPFAIVIDDEVLSAPRINEPIIGGSGQISGNFTAETANDLALVLNAGALPAKFEFVEERTVGPSLGADSIAAGTSAAIIGAILVLIFMIVAYGFLGIIANIALIVNITLLIATLSLLGATLTLPGIAGIVLTMGMAVDANVLIYERIREERRNGRNIIQSFDTGFKQALTTILDANVTTLIAAIILFVLGSGPVKGFAVTLGIGIFTTVFTAYTVTRLLVATWVKYKRPTELPKRLFGIIPENTKIKFMKDRKFSFPLSLMGIIASIVLFFTVSLNFGIDFKGGTLFELQPRAGVKVESYITDVRERMVDINVGEVQVQEFGGSDNILIRVESQGLGDSAEQGVEIKVRDVLAENYDFRRTEVVGPTVSNELRLWGTLSVIAALFAIMVYIWIRFEWQFALGAVLATLHDVIFTIGVFSALQLEFTLATIAALLTIVGYSLNDTVVVYDRIRENLRKYKKKQIPDLIDLSINQMLSRTILTSVTTLLALFSLYFLGGAVLESFTFAMIFGVFIGTYSSIFIAAPLLILFKLRPGQVFGAKDKEVDKEKAATANTLPVDFG